jgi:hypothetical protein
MTELDQEAASILGFITVMDNRKTKMTYNLTIHNKGALPIPYLSRVGEHDPIVDGLFKDRPLHVDALFIGATSSNQMLIHCTKQDIIIDPSPDLEIRFDTAPTTI